MPYGKFSTLAVTGPTEDGVLHVELARPKRLNAMNPQFWKDCKTLFNEIAEDSDTRAVVITAQGKIFTAGLDLKEAGQQLDGAPMLKGKDVGRKAWHIRREVLEIQASITAIEEIPQPVIVVGHSAVIGGGIDLMCACCIRYVSEDCWFSIKEVDAGLAADVGTLQRLPKIIGNEGLARELAYTSAKFGAVEAQRMGLVTRVFPTRDVAVEAAMKLAKEIASKSPIAVVGTKRMLTYSRDHSIKDGLDYVATWNSAQLQGPDMRKAGMAMIMKKKAAFSKL